MSKRVQHGIFWVAIYILWSYMKTGGQFYRPVFTVNLLNVGIYMIAFYTLRHYQLPKLYNRGKQGLFVLSLPLVSIALFLLWRLAGRVVWSESVFFPNRETPLLDVHDYLINAVQFYSPAAILLAWEFYQERQEEKMRVERLEKEKLATELKFLKAQINPHFLFNTLNNLYSFVLNQSPKAPDLILQLSGMLDYILYQSQKTTVALRQEVDCIQNFIELEKIRYGDRLQVDFEVLGDLTTPVAPLILLSLVENAFKHGASGDIEAPRIEVKIVGQEGQIHCVIWNSKSQFAGELNDAYKKGIGLSNTQRQLKLTYPNEHDLQIENAATYFAVNLQLQPIPTAMFPTNQEISLTPQTSLL
ncbi:MAG: histidine kinase [Bacteroidota bacterium]